MNRYLKRITLLVVVGLLPVAAVARQQPVALQGTVVTPERVIKKGWVVVQGRKIIRVSEKDPKVPGAVKVNTRGIIFPGLIDLHNHTHWNVFPRWLPGRLFSNRYEWRFTSEDYFRKVRDPSQGLTPKFFCDMNTYGEVRALVGGTTSMLATNPAPCIRGLVRNLDHHSGFYGDGDATQERIRHLLEIRSRHPTNSEAANREIAKLLEQVRQNLAGGRLDAFLIHLAEGKSSDPVSKEEFKILSQTERLLTKRTVIIHGVALGPAEFQMMRDAGASLVWSPRSNIELYGETTDIAAALDKGVRVALAPDWALSGSSNMLDELRYAAQWNDKHLAGRLSDRDLVEMVTRIPAEMVGIADKVGSIREGLYADLLVISGKHSNPYRALIQARPADVELVMIGGAALYGSPETIKKLWADKDLEDIVVGGEKSKLRTPSPADSFRGTESRLQEALRQHGVALAPLVEEK
jgi:5-methylthioadenosine/S-adenosylhomocysteine deaminase